jgi:hypothetical protein
MDLHPLKCVDTLSLIADYLLNEDLEDFCLVCKGFYHVGSAAKRWRRYHEMSFSIIYNACLFICFLLSCLFVLRLRSVPLTLRDRTFVPFFSLWWRFVPFLFGRKSMVLSGQIVHDELLQGNGLSFLFLVSIVFVLWFT